MTDTPVVIDPAEFDRLQRDNRDLRDQLNAERFARQHAVEVLQFDTMMVNDQKIIGAVALIRELSRELAACPYCYAGPGWDHLLSCKLGKALEGRFEVEG